MSDPEMNGEKRSYLSQTVSGRTHSFRLATAAARNGFAKGPAFSRAAETASNAGL